MMGNEVLRAGVPRHGSFAIKVSRPEEILEGSKESPGPGRCGIFYLIPLTC